jgi:hypothetical protein
VKKLNVALTVVLCMVAYTAFCGGKAKLLSGNLSSLKGNSISVSFVYDSMSVGKFKNESDYIAAKKQEYNAKEAVRGDKWEGLWKVDRVARFEPTFLDLVNKYAARTGMTFATSSDLFKMVVKTTFTEPGFNIMVARQPAVINTEYTFLDGSGKEIAKVSVTGATGSTFGVYDYDTGVRISEAYALSGKILGGFLSKMLK